MAVRSRIGPLNSKSSSATAAAAAGMCQEQEKSLVCAQQLQQQVPLLRLSSGFFVLNPDGDLAATQATFEEWLQQLGLQVSCRGAHSSRHSISHKAAA